MTSNAATLRACAGLLAGLFMLFFSIEVAEAIDGFSLQKDRRGYWHLVMPSEASEALRDSAHGFEPWPDSAYSANLRNRSPYDEHTSPFAIVRDLNGDGREDVALDGSWEQGRGTIVLLSEGNRYRVVGGPGEGWDPLPSKRRSSPGRGLRVHGGPRWIFQWAPGSEFDQGFRWSETKGGLQSWIN